MLFHDDSEPLANLASNQGSKMQVLELLITHYDVAFPDPYEATYKPPARPGEVCFCLVCVLFLHFFLTVWPCRCPCLWSATGL